MCVYEKTFSYVVCVYVCLLLSGRFNIQLPVCVFVFKLASMIKYAFSLAQLSRVLNQYLFGIEYKKINDMVFLMKLLYIKRYHKVN